MRHVIVLTALFALFVSNRSVATTRTWRHSRPWQQRRGLFVSVLSALFCAVVLSVSWVGNAEAFADWSGCQVCHGEFRAAPYISLVDGGNWPAGLHNTHRNTMLSGDCDTCHSGSFSPVSLRSSNGGNGLAPIGCVGCHGRDEDDAAQGFPWNGGRGAGLRQHHIGIASCSGCHNDQNPANYTPVGENVLPPYYLTPDGGHPNKPTDPCSLLGEEDYEGSAIGLDNDGDGAYDGADSDCGGPPTDTPQLSRNFVLHDASPNPFNPSTMIAFDLPVAARVRLSIYDVSGRLVKELLNEKREEGRHRAAWDGKDDRGQSVASGVYLYRLAAESFTETKRMVLLK
jgi:hypothetical protein